MAFAWGKTPATRESPLSITGLNVGTVGFLDHRLTPCYACGTARHAITKQSLLQLIMRPNGLSQGEESGLPGGSLAWLSLVLAGTLAILFCQSFNPHMVLAGHNGPQLLSKAASNQTLDRLTGSWGNLTWLGGETPSRSMGLTSVLEMILPPVLFLKIYAPMTLFFVGISAWVFFRSLQLSPMVCVLGSLAVALNMHFFSIACWGAASWNIGAAMMFLALGALSTKSIRQTWAKVVLAGLAVGMGVIEAYDVGAILSVYVGIFVVFKALSEEAPLPGKAMTAVWSEALVIFFALFIGAHTVSSLIDTQIKGISAMKQDDQTLQQRWNAATQWSLPKSETFSLFVPGLFGYRMAQHILRPDHSSAYWGNMGRDPRIDGLASDDPKVQMATSAQFNVPDDYRTHLNTPTRHERTQAVVAITKKGGIYWRYSVSGEFGGVLVSLLAVFGLTIVWKAPTPYTRGERAAVIFWGSAALFSLLMAWGRYGFLYRLLYHLPYMSTIRNPIKFLHPFHITWVILAAYGMEALYRAYLRDPARRSAFFPEHLQIWWREAAGFDKKWTIFALVVLGGSIVGLLIYNASKNLIMTYMEDQAISPQAVGKMAAFSITHAAWFVAFLAASMLVVTGILSGAWSETRAKWAWIFLGALIVFDLVRADLPWVYYNDYTEKYASNRVLDLLRDKPYEHRVFGKLEPRGPGSGITPGLGELYFSWLENEFPYYDIQSLDFANWPPIPDRDRLYMENFQLVGTDMRMADLRPAVRLWQLTNTRYVIGSSNVAAFLNDRADTNYNSFKVVEFFNMQAKPGVKEVEEISDITAESAEKGAFAVIEYVRALPRVKLYSKWQTPANEAAILKRLAAPEFEPQDTVLISDETPLPEIDSATTADPGTVEITQYHPKYVKMEADAKTPCVLLLNDRWNPDWRVWVDGAKSAVLRCNYIMRGVYLKPGNHTVEFRFQPSVTSLYISLCATVIGILLAEYLIVIRQTTP
jgi:hypothetical protein